MTINETLAELNAAKEDHIGDVLAKLEQLQSELPPETRQALAARNRIVRNIVCCLAWDYGVALPKHVERDYSTVREWINTLLAAIPSAIRRYNPSLVTEAWAGGLYAGEGFLRD